MFEAIHGSAPRRAGQNMANPTGLLLGAVQMLVHIGQGDVATRVHNAWLKTIEDGIHTYDVYDESVSTQKVGTREFADAVIERLGQEPSTLKAVSYPVSGDPIVVKVTPQPVPVKEQVGIDVFVEWRESVESLGALIEANLPDGVGLVMISNRGQKVYPGGAPETFCVDHWRCRVQPSQAGAPLATSDAIAVLSRLDAAGLPFLKTEGLYTFDGEPGYSLGQGQ
jgi:isocitrate dehydrogenase